MLANAKRLAKEQGFTLIEVVVVMSILATAIIPTFIMFYRGISFVESSKAKNQAVAVGEEKIEEIRNLAYSSVPTAEPNSLEDTKTLGGITFARDVDVVSVPSEITGADANIKKVTVTVSWTDAIGSKSISLVTFRTLKL